MRYSPYFHSRVVAIDVGIKHMGVAEAVVDRRWRIVALPTLQLVDLTCIPHHRVSYDECRLHHSRELYDRLSHFYQEHGHLLDRARVVLVERQPIGGLQAVQQSLFGRCRDRVSLVHPARLHRHFGLCGHYHGRKVEVCAIMDRMLRTTPHDGSVIHSLARRHDVADAVCMLAMYCRKREPVQSLRCFRHNPDRQKKHQDECPDDVASPRDDGLHA